MGKPKITQKEIEAQMNMLAEEFGVDDYDGMDAGPVPKTKRDAGRWQH